jgi:hypothetical protein
MNIFVNRDEIILALVSEFGETPSSFYNNERTKQREKFWTYNRLLRYYFKRKAGRKFGPESLSY